jgi:hypothetical protein
VFLATSPELERVGGLYFLDCNVTTPARHATDQQVPFIIFLVVFTTFFIIFIKGSRKALGRISPISWFATVMNPYCIYFCFVHFFIYISLTFNRSGVSPLSPLSSLHLHTILSTLLFFIQVQCFKYVHVCTCQDEKLL